MSFRWSRLPYRTRVTIIFVALLFIMLFFLINFASQ